MTPKPRRTRSRPMAPLVRPADGWIYISPPSGRHTLAYVAAVDEITMFDPDASGVLVARVAHRTSDPLYAHDNGEADVLIEAIRPLANRLLTLARARKASAA